MSRTRYIGVLIACLAAATAEAEDRAGRDRPMPLQDMQVTATREARLVYDVAQPVTLVDRREIERDSPQVLAEALRGRVGTAQRVMGALAKVSVSTLLIVHSSSEYSLSFCVRQADEEKAVRALREEFHFELLHGLLEDINVLSDRAVVSLVGEGMKHARGIAARFLTAISTAGVNVEVIAQGSTEFSISVVVRGEDARPAARSCHTAFFGRSTHIDVILLGCGNVGGELLDQFQRQEEALAAHHMDLRVRAIVSSEKAAVATFPSPVVNMWCDQTANPRNPMTAPEKTTIE